MAQSNFDFLQSYPTLFSLALMRRNTSGTTQTPR